MLYSPVMTAAPLPSSSRLSLADYIRLEEQSEIRHEFHDGEILAMSSGSPDHSLIISNTNALFHFALRGSPCRIYESNLRIAISNSARGVFWVF